MNIITALLTILNPQNLLWFLLGTTLGLMTGALPGIGASLTMALLIPVTFYLPPQQGLITLVAAWAAAVYGGSISSILINTPGTGANVATTFDGFPMARAGKARVALGLSAISSMVGGLFGVTALILFAPIIAAFAIKFGPAEYFLLAIFGLTIISTTTRGSALKGLIGAGVGLMISFIGYDIISGHLRYDFGTLYLQDGIPFLTVVIGLFAVTQALAFASEKGAIARAGKIEGSLLEGAILVFRHWKVLLKSCSIGTIFGFAPGVGTSAASLVAYGEAASSCNHPECFGKGCPDFSRLLDSDDEPLHPGDCFGKGCPQGVIAAESANNAVQGGALIPALTLGIPGNSDSAVFLAGLMMYGINPGRDLFERNASLVTILFVALVLAQISFVVVSFVLSPVFSKITLVPINILMPMVWLVAATGAYALHNNVIDVFAAIFLGIMGYIMRRNRFPIVPMLMAVILGPIAEKNFMRAMMLSDNSYNIFFSGSINWMLWGLILLALLIPTLRKYRDRKKRESK